MANMKPEGEIIIDFDGDAAQVTVKGVKGKRCTAITAQVEAALGQVVESTHTPDYEKQEVTRHERHLTA